MNMKPLLQESLLNKYFSVKIPRSKPKRTMLANNEYRSMEVLLILCRIDYDSSPTTSVSGVSVVSCSGTGSDTSDGAGSSDGGSASGGTVSSSPSEEAA